MFNWVGKWLCVWLIVTGFVFFLYGASKLAQAADAEKPTPTKNVDLDTGLPGVTAVAVPDNGDKDFATQVAAGAAVAVVVGVFGFFVFRSRQHASTIRG